MNAKVGPIALTIDGFVDEDDGSDTAWSIRMFSTIGDEGVVVGMYYGDNVKPVRAAIMSAATLRKFVEIMDS